MSRSCTLAWCTVTICFWVSANIWKAKEDTIRQLYNSSHSKFSSLSCKAIMGWLMRFTMASEWAGVARFIGHPKIGVQCVICSPPTISYNRMFFFLNFHIICNISDEELLFLYIFCLSMQFCTPTQKRPNSTEVLSVHASVYTVYIDRLVLAFKNQGKLCLYIHLYLQNADISSQFSVGCTTVCA